MKLTRKMLEGLIWFEENGPCSLFPNDGMCPSGVIRNRLEASGLIETCGTERDRGSIFSFVQYRISAAGRAALLKLRGR